MLYISGINAEIYFLSEYAITIDFGNKLNDAVNDNVQQLYQLIKRHPFPGLLGLTPAYATLSIFYDPLTVMANGTIPASTVSEKIKNHLESILGVEELNNKIERAEVIIPVCYGDEFGPDLDELANARNLSVNEVIALHSQPLYRVYMMGFVPGFAYLGGMDERLATPRKGIPRKAIPAGSVGIAGEQTGVYPLETPGGWQIIGRTPLRLFDAERDNPAFLKAGDIVKFKPVSRDEIEKLAC